MVDAAIPESRVIAAPARPPSKEQRPELPDCYKNSNILAMLSAQEQMGRRSTSLISDFDNSFFRPDQVEKTKQLQKIAKKFDIPTIIITGNSIQGLTKKIEEAGLEKPEIIVGAVGTEIFVLQKDGSYQKDLNFERMLKEAKFDRRKTVGDLSLLIDGWRAESSPHNAHELDFQHPEDEIKYMRGETEAEQPYKVSMYFKALDKVEDGGGQSRDDIEALIKDRFPDLEVAVCEEIGYNSRLGSSTERKKFCVDLLPKLPGGERGAKAGASNYLQELLSIKRGLNVGDSANDLLMLRDTRVGEGVVVGGAKEELERIVRMGSEPIANSHLDTGFIRTGQGSDKKRYFVDTDSSRKGPASIIEATKRRLRVTLRVETDQKMRDFIHEVLDELDAISSPETK